METCYSKWQTGESVSQATNNLPDRRAITIIKINFLILPVRREDFSFG
jgi:hypothetical protein